MSKSKSQSDRAGPSPQPTAHENNSGLSRRDLMMRGGTIAGGAAATTVVGSRAVPRYSPIGRAAAIAPVVPIGVAAGAAGVSYVAGVAHERYVGDDRDYSGYTGDDALWNEIETGALEMLSADERVMTSIENNIDNSQNIALSKGKAAIIEEMNAGQPEEDAQDAMEEAIDSYYATIQENIVTHYQEQAEQVQHHYEQVDTHEDLVISDVLYYEGNKGERSGDLEGGTYSGDSATDFAAASGEAYHLDEIGLIDGSTKDIHAGYLEGEEKWGWVHIEAQSDPDTAEDTWIAIGVQPQDQDGEITLYFDPIRYHDAWQSVYNERDEVLGDLSGFVTDVYAQYDPDDIPTEDLVDPITASTELRQDYDNRAGQGAHAALMGIPTNADFSAYLHIYDEELSGDDEDYYDVWAEIFTSHVPTDADGNEIGFDVGETYDPSTWDAPLYIAYEYLDEATGEERGDFTQIEDEFSIEVVEDAEGNEVENFQTRSRNNQTADVSELQNELEQLREDWLEMQEEAQEQDDGGGSLFGGDLFGGGMGGPIVGAVAVVLAMVGIGQATS